MCLVFLNSIESFNNQNFNTIENKTDQVTKLVHQECMVVVAHTWVRLRVTIKMMVIRTCVVGRDTNIVVVVVSAVVVVA